MQVDPETSFIEQVPAPAPAPAPAPDPDPAPAYFRIENNFFLINIGS